MAIPTHVAIVMDGNGRWAEKRRLPRFLGHRQGVKALERIVEAAQEIGVRYLTVYAFSVDNWKRPEKEVRALLGMLERYMDSHAALFKKNNIRLAMLGDMAVLPKTLAAKIKKVVASTGACDGLFFNVAFNYGARPEITQAVKNICKECLKDKIRASDIDEELIASFLYTRDVPDPDLFIRTGGEQRLSNFLLWQCSYTELYFTKTLWPDFDKACFIEAIRDYSQRQRRFGGI
jgi:undecaprenyl diphosphate synthase